MTIDEDLRAFRAELEEKLEKEFPGLADTRGEVDYGYLIRKFFECVQAGGFAIVKDMSKLM